MSTTFANFYQKHIKSTQIRANTSVPLIASKMNSNANILLLFIFLATRIMADYMNSYEGTVGCRMSVPTVSYGMIPNFLLIKDFLNYKTSENSTILRFGVVGMDALFNFAAVKYPTSGEIINQIGKSL